MTWLFADGRGDGSLHGRAFKIGFQLPFARDIRFGPFHQLVANARSFGQGPGGVGQMRAGHGTQVSPTGSNDAVDVIGLADGAHSNRGNARLLADAV